MSGPAARGSNPARGQQPSGAVDKGAPQARRNQTQAQRSGWRIPLCSTTYEGRLEMGFGNRLGRVPFKRVVALGLRIDSDTHFYR